MIDWLRKEFISEYVYSNIDEDRQCVKSVRINGRLYEKHGIDCATTAVALKYKVPVPGVKQFKTCFLVGIARQNPGDIVLVKDLGIEIAKTNALSNPVMVFEYNKEPSEDTIYFLLKSYVLGLPVQFVKTVDELKAEGKDLRQFERKINADYYDEYYKDCRKIFGF